jgi:hypothetical protein
VSVPTSHRCPYTLPLEHDLARVPAAIRHDDLAVFEAQNDRVALSALNWMLIRAGPLISPRSRTGLRGRHEAAIASGEAARLGAKGGWPIGVRPYKP